jgi:hypothetical protein
MSLTVHDLIAAYTADKVSPYRKLRHRTRQNYDSLLRRVDKDQGGGALAAIKYRTFLEWHADWSRNGARIPMAHALMGMVRTLVGFGVVFLEDRECERLSGVLHKMKFEMGKGRDLHLTADHADAVRVQAHKEGYPSMALAQAVQFEGTLRQKDIIGEWVPLSEPGVSDVTWARYGKWLRGLRWNEIDENLILRHLTSKTQKVVEIDLKLGPMVLEELQVAYCDLGEPLTRAKLPKSGPVILDEETGRPYLTHVFRRRWRMIARAAGVPDEVQNRDTRAGAITEAIESGASIEDAQKAAKHATPAMTAKYWRGDAKAAARAMTLRAADRVARKKQSSEQVA